MSEDAAYTYRVGTREHFAALERRSQGVTFYHGRYTSSDDCVLSFAAPRSLPWWICALHNRAHRTWFPLWTCGVVDWVSGGYCRAKEQEQ